MPRAQLWFVRVCVRWPWRSLFSLALIFLPQTASAVSAGMAFLLFVRDAFDSNVLVFTLRMNMDLVAAADGMLERAFVQSLTMLQSSTILRSMRRDYGDQISIELRIGSSFDVVHLAHKNWDFREEPLDALQGICSRYDARDIVDRLATACGEFDNVDVHRAPSASQPGQGDILHVLVGLSSPGSIAVRPLEACLLHIGRVTERLWLSRKGSLLPRPTMPTEYARLVLHRAVFDLARRLRDLRSRARLHVSIECRPPHTNDQFGSDSASSPNDRFVTYAFEPLPRADDVHREAAPDLSQVLLAGWPALATARGASRTPAARSGDTTVVLPLSPPTVTIPNPGPPHSLAGPPSLAQTAGERLQALRAHALAHFNASAPAVVTPPVLPVTRSEPPFDVEVALARWQELFRPI